MGSKKAVIVEPMEVFSVALQKRSVSIILVHNHPTALRRSGYAQAKAVAWNLA